VGSNGLSAFMTPCSNWRSVSRSLTVAFRVVIFSILKENEDKLSFALQINNKEGNPFPNEKVIFFSPF
jgi:hypothetical protein